MSDSFKGLELIGEAVAEKSKETGVPMSVSTVSSEPTSYRVGEFHVDRAGFERELIRLFDAYTPDRDNSWRQYGEDFENAVFRVRYDRQDGDCSCGHREEADAWHAAHPHKDECWQVRATRALYAIEQKRQAALDAALEHRDSLGWPWRGSLAFNKAQEEVYRISDVIRAEQNQWKTDNGWPKGKSGVLVHCDCGVQALVDEWFSTHGHKYPCDIWWMEQPNFLHKPSGYGVWWYKYPCRNAHGNQEMSVEQFHKLIDECIDSLAAKE